jgi:pSer/pThr/pTyr-binding forkhead associated (FHA) protein
MSKRPSDDIDIDNTDELPVLLESDVLGDEQPSFASQQLETTSDHTALYQAVEEPAAGGSALHAELAARAAETADLEAELATLAERARTLEQRLAEKDQLIGELKHTIATLRESAEDTSAAERRLATQLAIRDARLAEAATTIESLEREAAARVPEIDRLRAAAEAARRDAETARHEADAAKKDLAAQPGPSAMAPDIQELLEDNAALRDYIAGRQAWWDELQAKHVAITERAAAMELELATGQKGLAAAEAFAARESNRAVALRAELVEYARRADSLERELRATRDSNRDSRSPALVGPAATEPATSEPASQPTRDARPPPPAAEPPDSDAVGTVAPAVEAIAQLEAEVGYKRQQVAAQLVELRERDQRLHAAATDAERLRRDLSTMRNELDESRSTVARLERAVIDKGRALEARDARIATLHDELKQRLGAIEKLNAIDFSVSKVDSPASTRAASLEPGGDNAAAPALICLTGEAPKRFALTKKTITVGRGPNCDLQILTHFVSREHARITVTGTSVVIEDLGSRNGVYVNAVRVDRHALQHSDLLTIGETQFRFMESMAH